MRHKQIKAMKVSRISMLHSLFSDALLYKERIMNYMKYPILMAILLVCRTGCCTKDDEGRLVCIKYCDGRGNSEIASDADQTE